ncbi:MAG: ABC transporter substrate-binding protein [Patescibacteria group bacterium]|nr:ABC transporter substrate-binding protein [Patescibacteria group bacterium]
MQRRFQLRFRRQIKKSQRNVTEISSQVEDGIENLLFKRFNRLREVQRFVFSWILLLVILISGLVLQNITLSNYYQTVKTVPGGTYKEGILGEFSNANPLFATTNADVTVSHLIFASLMKYDSKGALVGDLAQSYEVDAKGLNYTVHLKPKLTWHDGKPLTSEDVLFTYQSLQNPDAQSPLQNSWKDITVSATNPQTVNFKLASPLASFAYNLTNGIVPKHILESVPVADLRAADFNNVRPVGSGPFMWQAIEVTGSSQKDSQEQIALIPFNGYNAGKPKLDKMIVHVFSSEKELADAFVAKTITAAQGLSETPSELKNKPVIQVHHFPLKAATMVFFKTTTGVLADKSVRNALVQAADVPSITGKLGYPSRLVREPLLQGQLGYDKAYAQPSFDVTAAKKVLDTAGWKIAKEGVRYKGKDPLSFSLSAADTKENKIVTTILKDQWHELGVKLNVQLQAPNDFQNTLTYHNYDALLYGIAIGTDPDVFVYWDGSQADVRSSTRLNFSEYKNATADSALESGRTRLDPAVRAFKYRPFLQAWQQDSPALGLYQPRLVYLTHGNVAGLSDGPITSATDRFANVEEWQIRQAKVTN